MKSISPGRMRPSSSRAIASTERGIFFQPADLLAQARVFLAGGCQSRLHASELTPGPNCFEQSLVAHEGIDDQHDRDQGENVIEDPVS